MRAILCKELGPANTLVIDDIPSPEPGKGQVKVRVKAAGLNFPDTLIIEGKYQIKPELPFSPGGEMAGEVLAVGDGIRTDIQGALGEGIDALFITGGLARGETGTSGQPDPEKLAAYLDEAQLSARWSIGYLR